MFFVIEDIMNVMWMRGVDDVPIQDLKKARSKVRRSTSSRFEKVELKWT